MSPEIEEFMEQDAQKGRYLTFVVDGALFGIEIESVSEIIRILPITEVPEVPSYVKGVINLRGRVLPVIDLRLKFRKEPLEYNERTCIIIVNMNDLLVGLIVDSVNDVLYIPDESIADPPEFKLGFQNRYIKGVGKSGDNVILLIDCDRLLSEEEFEEISKL